jgi:malate dehydrogenase (oxaloacetate-decarboxylating)(NADP+)
MSFPSQRDILETEATTAARVAEHMFEHGLARAERPQDIRAWLESLLYKPEYAPLRWRSRVGD